MALARRFRALQQLAEQRGSPDHRVTPPICKRRDDRGGAGSAVRLEDTLDRSYADMWQIDGPNEHRAGLERLQRAERPSERGDRAGFRLGILYDHAVVACKKGLDAGGVGPEDDDSRFDLESFQCLQDSDDEREAQEIQEGFRRAHPGRPASRQHDAR